MNNEKKYPREIIIYCPDCGDIFKLEPHRGYYPTCKRWYLTILTFGCDTSAKGSV